jgi:hypothetical protein
MEQQRRRLDWKRRLLLALGFASLAFFAGPWAWWSAVGLWRGEAFYRSRSVSQWSREIQHFHHDLEVETVGVDSYLSQGGKPRFEYTACKWINDKLGINCWPFKCVEVPSVLRPPAESDRAAAIAVLRELLQNDDPNVFAWSLIGLRELGTEAHAAIPDLLDMLEQTDSLDTYEDLLIAVQHINLALLPGLLERAKNLEFCRLIYFRLRSFPLMLFELLETTADPTRRDAILKELRILDPRILREDLQDENHWEKAQAILQKILDRTDDAAWRNTIREFREQLDPPSAERLQDSSPIDDR